jgi:hypothetical protein
VVTSTVYQLPKLRLILVEVLFVFVVGLRVERVVPFLKQAFCPQRRSSCP